MIQLCVDRSLWDMEVKQNENKGYVICHHAVHHRRWQDREADEAVDRLEPVRMVQRSMQRTEEEEFEGECTEEFEGEEFEGEFEGEEGEGEKLILSTRNVWPFRFADSDVRRFDLFVLITFFVCKTLTRARCCCC